MVLSYDLIKLIIGCPSKLLYTTDGNTAAIKNWDNDKASHYGFLVPVSRIGHLCGWIHHKNGVIEADNL